MQPDRKQIWKLASKHTVEIECGRWSASRVRLCRERGTYQCRERPVRPHSRCRLEQGSRRSLRNRTASLQIAIWE